MSLRQILQSPYKSQRTTIHGGCTTRASAEGMTARASNSAARASVTRFIENLPCIIEVVGRRGPPTAASIVSPADYASENGGGDGPGEGVIFLLFPTRPRGKRAGGRRRAARG